MIGSEEGDEPEPRPYRTPWGSRAPDNPWWIAPIFGRVPDVPSRNVSLLGTVALALLFEQYDQAMLTAAASQIAATFGLQESDLAWLFLRIQAGSLVAFFLVPFADRLGQPEREGNMLVPGGIGGTFGPPERG